MTGSGETDEMGDGACDCKVGSVSRTYDIDGTLAELEARWTAPEAERESVRELTRAFNEAVLGAGLREAGAVELTGDAGRLYHQLTDDDISSGTRTTVRRRLGRAGVPVDRVSDQFVSHQSLYLHLTECRELTYEGETGDRPERTRKQLRALRERLVRVAEDKLDRLDGGDHLNAGAVSVLVDVDVYCDDCGASAPLEQFIDGGGCDCGDAPDETA